MKAMLTAIAGTTVPLVAGVGAMLYIHPLVGGAIFFAFFMYVTGALMSAHSFFGYTISMGGLYR